MGLLDICSNNSYWRGYHYFKGGMVKEVIRVDDGVYDAIVEGSKEYKVHLDINHPRKSSCSCPHADGKRIICKHIVAVYFAVNPKEVKRIDKKIEMYEEERIEAEEKYNKAYKEVRERVIERVQKMSNEEVKQMLINYLINSEMEYYDKQYEDYNDYYF